MTKLAVPIRSRLEFDAASSTTNYVGEAAFNVATSAPFWRIKRLSYTSGSISIDWADGNDNFDNVWDNRTSLSYS